MPPGSGSGAKPQGASVAATGLLRSPFSRTARRRSTVNPEDARQQTLQLVALGVLDDRRRESQILIDAVPRILASRSRGSKDAEAYLKGAEVKHRGFKAHLKSLELDLAAREAALSKANVNLMSAKSNQEYSLLIAEIARKREDKSLVETSILEQYEVIKQGEGMVADCKRRLQEALAEYSEFEARAHTDMAEHQMDMTALDVRREALRRGIDAEALKLYDRAYGAHGKAIVPAEGKTCQGCFSILTPNDNNRLLSGRQIVLCRSCQRILYMPETLQASPS